MYLGTSPFKAWGLINPRPSEPPAPQHEASGCFGEDKPRLLPSGLTGAHQEQQLQHPATTGPPLGPHHSPPGPSAASALHLPAQPPPSHSPHTTFPSRTFCGCPLSATRGSLELPPEHTKGLFLTQTRAAHRILTLLLLQLNVWSRNLFLVKLFSSANCSISSCNKMCHLSGYTELCICHSTEGFENLQAFLQHLW